jgi:hypothetical protein
MVEPFRSGFCGRVIGSQCLDGFRLLNNGKCCLGTCSLTGTLIHMACFDSNGALRNSSISGGPPVRLTSYRLGGLT